MTAGHPTVPFAARVLEVAVENHRVRTFTLDRSLDAEPGQFAMLWLPGLDEKPFSLLEDDPLRFTIAAVGPFSRALHGLAPGDPLWVRGPFGRGFDLQGDDHLVVGGGYGVAPMLFLARRALARGHRVRAVIGARTAADVLLEAPFRAAGAEVHLTTEDGSAGTPGRVTDGAAPLVVGRRPDALYACGPHGMLAALRDLAGTVALPAQLSWEAYMRCAVGICGSCEHEGLLLCADGPVVHEAPAEVPAESAPAPFATTSRTP